MRATREHKIERKINLYNTLKYHMTKIIWSCIYGLSVASMILILSGKDSNSVASLFFTLSALVGVFVQYIRN